jgi:predicted metal-dependent phosphoesterase TrpH
MRVSEQKTETQTPFDLHLHSNCSDGFDAPARVVEQAKECGVTLMALTDHDSVSGVPEALQAGDRLGLRVLPAIEMDTEWPHELHILGLDIDIFEPVLVRALEQARTRRGIRNNEIAQRLKSAGYDILPYLNGGTDVATRLNIAIALVAGGFAESTRDAFVRFLRKGCIGYYAVERFPPEEVISLIRGAGGIPVWAHPMHGHPDLHALTAQLKSFGLMGLEAYHSSMSEGEGNVLVSIARQQKLLVTCGSDYHGANRPGVLPGQTWREHAALRECRAALEARPVRALPVSMGAKTN